MSTRALKKLQQKSVVVHAHSDDKNLASNSEQDDQSSPESSLTSNRFLFLEANDHTVAENTKDGDKIADISKSSDGQKSKKKQKKKRKPDKGAKSHENNNELLDDIAAAGSTALVGDNSHNNSNITLTESDLFKIEYRHLNIENELKRIFGKVVGHLTDSATPGSLDRRPLKKVKRVGGPAALKRTGGRLVATKNDSRITKTGLSMSLVKSLNGGVNLFKFEYNQAYLAAQSLFLDAVETLNPELFMAILKDHPFHIDTLVQVSEIYRMNEDFGTARDLIERAISACQAAFHSFFNVALNNSRLEYRQRENRPFFLALNKHVQYIAQKGCFRTALEFCKLIYSLDPEQDPLGTLMNVDYFCLRSKQYDYLINFYYLLEVKRNLSQLPNFCYSLALAHFLNAKAVSGGSPDLTEADEKLKDALVKFPTLLPLLLNRCNVEPDKQVSSHEAFSPASQHDGQGLKALYTIYVNRVHDLWKEPEIVQWLERVVCRSINDGDFSPSNKLYAEFRANRETRYKTVPLNVCRHVVLSGEPMTNVLTYLPVDVRDNATQLYDPVPPPDTVYSYEVPSTSRNAVRRQETSILSAFLRSLMPNYNNAEAQHPGALEDRGAAAAVPQDPAAAANNGQQDFQQSVQAVLRAMRDLLADIQPAPADREDANNGNAAAGDFDDNDEWADDFD